MTLECNLNCKHCGSNAGKAKPNELNTEECLKLISDLSQLGCQYITLSGGEPTLRSDWDIIVEAIRNAGLSANIITNGMTINRKMAKRMRDLGLNNVGISIEGPQAINDKIRGEGSFECALKGIQHLNNAGVPVVISTTICSLNLPYLEEIYRLCIKLGVKAWRVQMGKPMGRLDQHRKWLIEPKDLLYLLPRLHMLAEEGSIIVGIGDSIGFHGPFDDAIRLVDWKGNIKKWGGCQAGIQAIGIEADGGIKGCLSLQSNKDNGYDPFLEGNIRKRSIKDIWFDSEAFSYNRSFKETDLTGFCANCKHRLTCRAGAKCVSAAVTGNLSNNPYCYYMVAERIRNTPVASSIQRNIP